MIGVVRFLFLAAAAGLLWGGFGIFAARAQTAAEPGILSPTSGWLVGPAAIAVPAGVKDMPLPCVMLNQFDNGFVMRLSGGGQRLAALVIDFRQAVFTTGQRYPLRIFILPDYKGDFAATAHDSSTLIVNLGNDRDIYRALAPANGMDLSIGPTVVRFDLTGLSDGLRRLETCFGRSETASVRSERLPPMTAPPPAAMDEISDLSMDSPPRPPSPREGAIEPAGIRTLSTSRDDPLKIMGRSAPLPMDRSAAFSESKLNGFTPDETARNPSFFSGASTSDQKSDTQVWRASKGENVQEVLSRWSRKEGVSLVWTARRQGQVGADFRYEGTFEEAVSAFLAQSSMFQGEMRDEPPEATSSSAGDFR